MEACTSASDVASVDRLKSISKAVNTFSECQIHF